VVDHRFELERGGGGVHGDSDEDQTKDERHRKIGLHYNPGGMD
jgi:hypothetical protein